MKKLSHAIALAGVMTVAAVPAVQAEDIEVSASAAVANMYLWRGQDLGDGAAAVSGDLVVSTAGAYAGVWTSSGDSAAGQEYDVFMGYGMESGDFSADLSIWTYVYPDGNKTDGNFGDNSEVILSLGFAGADLGIYKQVGSENDNGNMYYTLGYGMDQFSAMVGLVDSAADGSDYTHLDLGYAYNDNLSFTLSKIVDEEEKNTYDTDLQIAVSYSLPIEM